MMTTQELKQQVMELTNTTTATGNISDITPEVWSDDVEAQGEDIRQARNFVIISRKLMGVPGDVDHVLKGARLVRGTDVDTSSTEATEDTVYALDDYGTLDNTPVPYTSTVRISDEVIEEVQIDVLADANRMIAEVLAQYEDAAILVAINTGAGNEVYGGDAAADGDLDTGDIITTDLVANAITECEVDRYNPNVMFIRPEMKNAFLKDSQFVNAAEYGGNQVVQSGEIGNYLGITIVTTNNLPGLTPNSGTAYASLMWDSTKACVLSLKTDIRIESDREVATRSYVVVGRIKFAAGVLFANAICSINCTTT